MVKRYKGGLMSGTEAVTSTSDSRGMWGTVQATQARNTGNWSGLLATETPGSGSGAGFANGFMTVSNVSVTNSSYTVLDDTPNISTAGGYIKLTGRGFVSGCVVYVGGVAATSTTFISSTEVRAQIAATSSNTLMVYVVNPDGSTGIKLSSLTFSGTPTWSTGETLSGQVSDVAFSVYFSATSDSAVTYSLSSGSSLPAGTSLFANGLFTGTVTGLSSDTTYSFSVNAVDAERQDTARTFSVTFSTGDAYFALTSLLLNGEANVWIRDSSVNNFLPTIGNDTKPSAFSPYNTNWSAYFDRTNDYLAYTYNTTFGSGNFTVECWVNMPSITNTYGSTIIGTTFYDGLTKGWSLEINASGYPIFYLYNTSGTGVTTTSSTLLPANQWTHLAAVRSGTTVTIYMNGVSVASGTNATTDNFSNSIYVATNSTSFAIGVSTYSYAGYISNARVVVGVAVYTGNFTPPTTPLSNTQSAGTNIAAITGTSTSLLTLQDNRFKDNSSNAFAVTPTGDVAIRSFGPFVDTDTTTGSAYFDGTGDYLTIADNTSMELGAGDFCVECWIYTTSVANTAVVIDKRSGGYAPILLWRSTSTLQLYSSLNGSSWGLANGVTVGTLTVNQWYHVAIFRVGSSLYTSFNGTVTLVTASGSGTLVNNATNWYIGTETNGSTNPWTGYIADMRFVVGSSAYTAANFTPATSSLSSVANTQLLTLQYRRGENNHRFIDEAGPKAIITRAGNASQGSFSPFSPAGWSAYFGGVGNYIVTDSAAFSASQSTFTIECWIYMTATPTAANPSLVGDATPASSTNYWSFGPNTSRNLAFYWYDSSGKTATGNTTLSLSTWYHVAVSVNANAITMYVNGNSESLSGTTTLTNRGGTTSIIAVAQVQSSYNFIGYISNLSILAGTAKYSGTFTPFTSPLSASTTNQVFLFGGTNLLKDLNTATTAKAIVKTGLVSAQAFSPFRGSGFYSPATHGGSAYFDGSGDYVSVASSTAMTLLTNNHTIEFWMYPDGAQSVYACPWYYNGSIVYYFSIGSYGGGDITLLVGGGSPWTLAITTGNAEYLRILNNWNHVVITRSGTAFRMFFNGILRAYGTASQTISAQTSAFQIGWDGTNATTYYKGWLSNFRVINGSIPTAYQTAVTTTGTSVFTPPTAVPAFEANTAMQTSFTQGGIVDATTRIVYETAGAVTVSNVQSKFGIGSISFPGALTAYLKAPTNPLLDFGTGDFTVEFWVYFNSVASDQGLFGGSTTNAWEIRWRTSTGLNLGRLNTAFDSTFAWSPSATTWYHVAVTRSGTSVRGFVNGSQIGTTSTNSNTYNSGTLFYIGITDTSNNAFNGYLDDVRITKGFARYTANFTAPNSAAIAR